MPITDDTRTPAGSTVDDRSTSYDRLIAKLGDPHARYTSAQVVFLMAAAVRWQDDRAHRVSDPAAYIAGWVDGWDSTRSPYPPAPVLIEGKWIDQLWHRAWVERENADRENEWTGGDAETALARFMWDDPWVDRPAAPVTARTRRTRDGLVWA